MLSKHRVLQLFYKNVDFIVKNSRVISHELYLHGHRSF